MSGRSNDLMSVLVAIGLGTGAAMGSVLHVDDDALPAGDGQSWATAYRFLQDALAEARSPRAKVTEIRVAQGRYRPDRDEANPAGTGDRMATFALVDGVLLAGAYAGVGAPDPDERDVPGFVTTLDGDLLGDDGPDFDSNDDNSWHVVTGSGNDASAIIDGFTITAGNADGPAGEPAYHASGGGMIIVGGSPTVRSCRFELNAAECKGAGLVINDDSHPTISGSTFIGNVAQHPILGAGGAIRCGDSSVAIFDCSFVENDAKGTGRGGGAISSLHSTLDITGALFLANDTSGEGGAMATISGTTWLRNSTVIRNVAHHPLGGGGLCTMNDGRGNGTTYVDNSIIVWNEASSDPQILNRFPGDVTRVSSSNTEGGLDGDGTFDDGGNIDADPLFVDPDGADEDPANDHHLAAGSSSIDAGDLASVPDGVLTDHDGNPRLIDCQVDMGAYEHQAALFAPGDADCDGVVGFTDLLVLLASWGTDGLSPADTDHDGDVDFVDLITLLDNWT